MSGFDQDDLTQDAFLGGRVMLWQPRRGYRAGVDPVLLAASVQASSGQSVLELGCGAGAAILCLGARVAGLSLTGVERDAGYAALARRNGQDALNVVLADLEALPASLREHQFDHVIANPPFFDRAASRPSQDPRREVAHAEQTALRSWVKVAGKRLKPKGSLSVIHRAERLPDLLSVLAQDIGSVEVLPISARPGRSADRIILRGRKNGRAGFRLHAPLVMHTGTAHIDDTLKDYCPQVQAILQQGAALDF